MHVLVTGGTGFIGTALVLALMAQGYTVSVLTRQTDVSADLPGEKLNYIQSVESLDCSPDAVINLAGASLADKRWTANYKTVIQDSRIRFTKKLGESLAARGFAPSIWISGSAIGYYGASLEERFVESDPAGEGFAAQLCVDWEQSANEACGDARLCLLRIGVVLDRDGGAFAQMAQPFKFGLANWIGHGRQWLSWIHRDDVVAAILHLLADNTLSGAFNLTAPEAVTSRQFCQLMQRHYRTLIAMPMPAAVMRVIVGGMAEELLLQGQQVVPAALIDSGFQFKHPDLDSALKQIRS